MRVPFRALAIASLLGVATSAVASVTETTDEATVKGLVVLISVALGLHLGSVGSLWVFKCLRSYVNSLERRVDKLIHRLGIPTDADDAAYMEESVWSVLWKYSWWLLPIGLYFVVVNSLQWIMDYRVDVYQNWPAHIPLFYLGLTISVVSLSILVGRVWMLDRRIARVERTINPFEKDSGIRAYVRWAGRILEGTQPVVNLVTGNGSNSPVTP